MCKSFIIPNSFILSPELPCSSADFNIEGTMLVFNSSHVGQTLCASFEPVNDLIVEATECFYFIATAQYMRDVFTDAVTQVCIIDNDGKLKVYILF